jgi:hypothetical protein
MHQKSWFLHCNRSGRDHGGSDTKQQLESHW